MYASAKISCFRCPDRAAVCDINEYGLFEVTRQKKKKSPKIKTLLASLSSPQSKWTMRTVTNSTVNHHLQAKLNDTRLSIFLTLHAVTVCS